VMKQYVEVGEVRYVTAATIKTLRKVYAEAKEVVNLMEDDEDIRKGQHKRRQQIL